MNANIARVSALSDGVRTSVEIAALVGLSARYVRRIMFRNNLPRRKEGAQSGSRNHQFVCGRRIDRDGYVLVTVPNDHPHARQRTNRQTKLMFEHRLVMERTIGRFLLPTEIVDHKDGLHLHNAPDNLRLFQSNADHLRATISGKRPAWSKRGYQNIGARTDRGIACSPVDTHRRRRESGDVRLRQILLAALSLGIDSPFLLGTHRHLEKAGIDASSRSTIERALADLSAKYASDLAPS